MKYGLTPKQLQEIESILRACPEVQSVWLFGSRALDTYKEASDIDLAVKGPLGNKTLLRLKDAFEESDLPFFVDLVEYAGITEPALKQHIDTHGVCIFDGGEGACGMQNCKLGDVIKFGNGKVRPSSEGATPIYGGNGILGYSADANYVGETVVIGRVGAYCGATYYENQPIWVSDNALSAKPKDKNNAKYLFYFLKHLDLNQHAQGSSHPLVTQTLLNSIDVEIVGDPDEQKAIAAVLTSLDDKVDLLHRQNKTLEAMAETLFRQRFVEEAHGDWEVCTLDDVISVKGGTTPSTKEPEYWDGNICWSTPRDLSNHNSVFLFDTERKISEKGLAQIGSGLLPIGTVLLSSRAPIGYLAITDIPVAINQGYIAIVCDKLASNYFMFLWCLANMDEIKSAGNGSTFEEISKSNFKALPLIIPSKDKLLDFDKVIAPTFEKIKTNQRQIRTLENLRDTLLPKLMSGEVRVKV